MKIIEVLYKSGVCKAHGEVTKILKAGIVSQQGEVITNENAEVLPVELHPIKVGKHKIINFIKWVRHENNYSWTNYNINLPVDY